MRTVRVLFAFNSCILLFGFSKRRAAHIKIIKVIIILIHHCDCLLCKCCRYYTPNNKKSQEEVQKKFHYFLLLFIKPKSQKQMLEENHSTLSKQFVLHFQYYHRFQILKNAISHVICLPLQNYHRTDRFLKDICFFKLCRFT